MIRRLTILSTIVLGLVLGGCTQVAVEAAKKAFEDRTTEDQVTDSKISAGILQRLSDRDKGLLLDLNWDVWEQRVLVTGVLDDSTPRADIVRLVRNDDRIKAFHEHVATVSKADRDARRKQAEAKETPKEEPGVGQTVNDFWLETKINAQLLAARGVTSVNYRWRSVLNQVYVIGRAPSAAERDQVLRIVRETVGIKGVRDYIEIKAPRA